MSTGKRHSEAVIEQSLVRIRRDQARRLQRQDAAEGGPKSIAANAARLRYLDALEGDERGRTISQVAEAIGVDRPRASRLTTELFAENLIERQVSLNDSRYSQVTLTDAGRVLIGSIREERRRAVGEALAAFTEKEAREFASLLERFVEAWPRD
ncbi:MAG TPA: MarR family transcriptional regulator [Glycomyces sp.]|nr:MarR family transcriptional regulator [Glycomyces sp.]